MNLQHQNIPNNHLLYNNINQPIQTHPHNTRNNKPVNRIHNYTFLTEDLLGKGSTGQVFLGNSHIKIYRPEIR